MMMIVDVAIRKSFAKCLTSYVDGLASSSWRGRGIDGWCNLWPANCNLNILHMNCANTCGAMIIIGLPRTEVDTRTKDGTVRDVGRSLWRVEGRWRGGGVWLALDACWWSLAWSSIKQPFVEDIPLFVCRRCSAVAGGAAAIHIGWLHRKLSFN